MATPEEIAKKEEERILKALQRSERGQGGKPAPVVKPKHTVAVEPPKPKSAPRPTSSSSVPTTVATKPAPTTPTPVTTTPVKPVDKQPSVGISSTSGGTTTRTVESAALPKEKPPKREKDPKEKEAKKEWRMKNKKWTIEDLMRVSEEALQGKHKAPHRPPDEYNEDWKKGAETVDNLLHQRQAQELEQQRLEQEARKAQEQKKKKEVVVDPAKEKEELEKLLSISFLPVEETSSPVVPSRSFKEETSAALDELDGLLQQPLPPVPSYTPTPNNSSTSFPTTVAYHHTPAPAPVTRSSSSSADLDNIASDLSDLDNLIHSFVSETSHIASERQAQHKEAEERKRREKEREVEELKKKEEQKRKAVEEKQQQLRQWEEERNKLKAAEELLRQRDEVEQLAKAQVVEQQAQGKKEISAAGKTLITALDDFENGNYGREVAVSFVSAIQKINENVALVFPPRYTSDSTRGAVEATMKEIISMGTETVNLVKKNPITELDKAEIHALRLAIRSRLSQILKEVQKATATSTVYDEKKIEEALSFPVTTTTTTTTHSTSALLDFKRKAAALGHKAGEVLQQPDLNVPSLTEVLGNIEATFSEFTQVADLVADQHARKKYTEAVLHVNSLGRKLLRDPLDFPVRMLLIQAVLEWLQALGHLA